jgi:hypothetical protein
MWLGMLVFANGAMYWATRRPKPRGQHVVAMFTGGNLGMVFGMVAGGWCGGQIETTSVSAAAAFGIAGMTAGMMCGMLTGTWMTEWVIGAAWTLRTLPRWLRASRLNHTAG